MIDVVRHHRYPAAAVLQIPQPVRQELEAKRGQQPEHLEDAS